MSKPTAFPLDESKLPFRIPKDQPFRENIAKLGQMITDRIPAKKGTLTQDDPEYWGLASIVTDEMAEVALKMKVRKPMTLPELVKATGKPADELEPLLQQMAVARKQTPQLLIHFATVLRSPQQWMQAGTAAEVWL